MNIKVVGYRCQAIVKRRSLFLLSGILLFVKDICSYKWIKTYIILRISIILNHYPTAKWWYRSSLGHPPFCFQTKQTFKCPDVYIFFKLIEKQAHICEDRLYISDYFLTDKFRYLFEVSKIKRYIKLSFDWKFH